MAIQVTNTSSQLSGKTLMDTEDAQTVAGVKTFSAAPIVNAGIKFPAVQVPIADVNTLDDYEEGTFNISWASSGGGSATYTAQSMTYVKIGRFVFFTGRLSLSSKGTLAAGTATITGFPFTAASIYGTLVCPYFAGLTTAVTYFSGYITPGTTIASPTYVAAAATGVTALTVADLANNTDIVITGQYYTNA